MPSSPFSVWINILGSVNPSVALSIGAVNKGLIGLQATAVATNTVLSTLGRGLGLIAGIGGGLLAIGSIAAGYRQAIKLSLENEQIQEATLQILQNQRAYRHENVALAQQDLDLLNQQAVYLQEQTGIYKNVFERGSLILAQTRRTKSEIVSLNASIANLLASQTMQGKSAESMVAIYEAVGKAIQTGMARNLNAVGIILDRREKQLLNIYAWQHNYAASIKLIENAINRTYGGEAARRMGTLTGQSALAMAHMQQSLEHMGDAMKPIQQRLTIIFSKIVTLFEPLVVRVANLVNSFMERHMKDIEAWISIVQHTVIPVMLDWINRGWKAMITAIQWIKKNWDWLQPLVLGAAAGLAVFVALAAAIGGIAAVIAIVSDPIVQLAAAFMAVGAAIGFVWKNWKMIGPVLTNFANFVKGGVEAGWKTLVDWVSNKAWTGLKSWVSNALNWIGEAARNWIGAEWQNFITWSKRVWDTTVAGLKLVGTALWNFVLSPFNWFYQKFLDFLRWIHVLPAVSSDTSTTALTLGRGGRSAGGGATGNWPRRTPTQPNRPGGALGGGRIGGGETTADLSNISTVPFQADTSGSRRLNAIYNNPGALGLGALARSFGGFASGKYDTGHPFAAFPTKVAGAAAQFALWGNKRLYAGHTLAAAIKNWIGPGEHGEAEAISKWTGIPLNAVITPELLRGPLGIKLMQAQARYEGQNVLTPEEWKRAQDWAYKGVRGDVTINYTVHHHGDTDEHRLAQHHRRHLDTMKKELAEVLYRNNRASFDGAIAV